MTDERETTAGAADAISSGDADWLAAREGDVARELGGAFDESVARWLDAIEQWRDATSFYAGVQIKHGLVFYLCNGEGLVARRDSADPVAVPVPEAIRANRLDWKVAGIEPSPGGTQLLVSYYVTSDGGLEHWLCDLGSDLAIALKAPVARNFGGSATWVDDTMLLAVRGVDSEGSLGPDGLGVVGEQTGHQLVALDLAGDGPRARPLAKYDRALVVPFALSPTAVALIVWAGRTMPEFHILRDTASAAIAWRHPNNGVRADPVGHISDEIWFYESRGDGAASLVAYNAADGSGEREVLPGVTFNEPSYVVDGRTAPILVVERSPERQTVYNLGRRGETCAPVCTLKGSSVHQIAPVAPDGVLLQASSWTVKPGYLAYNAEVPACLPRLAGQDAAPEIAVATRHYHSPDRTQIPATILKHRECVTPARTLVYVYGGFGIGLWPGFMAAFLDWIRRGGILVLAHVRGGNEYGVAWHFAGKGANKVNTIRDTAAVLAGLADDRETTPDRLGLWGQSNGGLVALSTALQYPARLGCVVAGNPVVDIAQRGDSALPHVLKDEYTEPAAGLSEDEIAQALSPARQVEDGAKYPAVLVTTAEHDQRVPPQHGWHMIQTLLSRAAPGQQAYLLHDRGQDHGGGTLADLELELARVVAFCERMLAGPGQ